MHSTVGDMIMNNELMATAYHEAGHAVVAYLHGRRFKYVSIEPNEEQAGVVGFYDSRIISAIIEGTHCNIWLLEHPDEAGKIVERAILSTMAGYIAQDMGVPGSVELWQWESDREYLVDILIAVDLDYGYENATATVRQELNDNWYLVEGLVNTLIEKKTLTGKDARRILIRQKEAYLACIPQRGI